MSEKLIKGLKLGSPTNPVIVSLIEYEGHRLLDIRKYFIEKETKTPKPTRKGVSLNATLAREVQAVINANETSIFEWLEKGGGEVLTEVEQAMLARSKAADEEAVKPRRFSVKEQGWKGAEFFAFNSSGADDQLALNIRHPFIEKLKNGGNGSTTSRCPISLLLAAYYRAKLRFSGEIEADAENFFRLFEHEWGLLLKNYCQNENTLNHG
jgi:hypothetical protein